MNTMRTNTDAGAGPVEKPARQHRVLQPQLTEREVPPAEEQKEEKTEEVKPEWPLTVKLKKPIKLINAQDNTVVQQYDVLEFREPTAQDIIAVGGSPIVMLDYAEAKVQFDGQRMAQMMARLSRVALNYIQTMDSIDFINCATMLQRNFMPDWGRML